MGHVLRQIQQEKKKISAPKAVKHFNHGMQAVNRFDQLMSLYLMTKRHPFKKWYKNTRMALMDMGMVNVEIHYHMRNPKEKKKDGHRFKFCKLLCCQLITMNWAKFKNMDPSEAEEELRRVGVVKKSSSEDEGSTQKEQCTPVPIRRGHVSDLQTGIHKWG